MKKLLFITLALLLAGSMAFSLDGQITVRGAAGIMYLSPLYYYTDFSLYNFRAGIHGDLMYDMGMIEIGAEVGVYVMEVEIYDGWYTYYYLGCEIPVNAIVRINIDSEKTFAFEARGGVWFKLIMDDYFEYSDVTFNIGGRFALSVLYVGADYVWPSIWEPAAIAIEAGIKIPLQ